MEDLLIEILEEFRYPVRLQGSLSESEPYPEHFFTFWNNNSFGESYYDNNEQTTTFTYDINFYSVDPQHVYEILRQAIVKLRNAGFIISGDGHSVASDEPTHDGRGITAQYLRRN